MPTDATEDTRTYIVLVNHEEQYSLWLADKQIPLGWSAVGEPGSKEECLAYARRLPIPLSRTAACHPAAH